MAFSQSNITSVTTYRDGQELAIAWTSSDPAGTVFQVYIAGVLHGSGTARTVLIPWPADFVTIEVGSVAATEAKTDFSGSLPAVPADRAELTWEGGRFQGMDIAGFHVYKSATAGGAVDYAAAIATIPAFTAGIFTDGFGVGGFGAGGFGSAANSYSWTSDRLASGTWNFAVAAFDTVGNEEGSPATTSATISVPPRPPTASSDGTRLNYSYNATTHIVTLTWLASPDL